MKKSVVIATPDASQRARLGTLLNQMPEFEVIARTADLMNTYNVVEERLPKAVLIADALASLPEFEVMRALFSTLDIRWLVVTMPNRAVRPRTAPSGPEDPGSDLFSIPADAPEAVLLQQICALTRTEMSRPPAAKPQISRPGTAAPTPSAPARPHVQAAVPSPDGQARPLLRPPTARPGPVVEIEPRHPAARQPVPQISARASRSTDALAHPLQAPGADRMILIGASTGGVDALLTVLTRFPADCPPTLVVQHTGTGFGESLAALLHRQCLPSVSLATGATPIRRGHILIGAGIRMHLVVEGRAGSRTATLEGGPVSGHVPSVDMLFRSAVPLASRVFAALLTGMGRDGAEGMKALHAAGAVTIAQDEASCVVYGMPRTAVEMGAVRKVLPLDRIAEALLADPSGTERAGREIQK